MNLNKIIILIRHCSGAGSSTFGKFLADNLNGVQFEADSWMFENGEYKFKAEKLGYCHKSCFDSTEQAMKNEKKFIVVNNTLTTQKEVQIYLDLAEKYNYTVFSVVLEKRHDNPNLHGVNSEILEKQKNKLINSLKLI